jgi:arylsulfatase B
MQADCISWHRLKQMQKLKSIVQCAGVGSVLILFSCDGENQNLSDKSAGKLHPNIILIVVDDQGYADLSCAGLATDVQTPNLDQLAKSGVRFTNAYATSSISSPSRCGLLTGCYQQRWGTFWYGGPGLKDSSIATIPELLKRQGYQTAYIGKVHYGSYDSDTTNRSFPLNHGFDYYFGHTSARKHYINHVQEKEQAFLKVKKDQQKSGQSLRQQAMWENYSKVDTVAFSTSLFGSKACDYISKNKEEPFFLQLSFNAVHNFTHQLPEAYLKEHGLDGYHDWDPAEEEYYDWYVKGRKPNNPEGREQYLGQLHYLDSELGKVLECLRSNDIEDNTMVIYISDNGGSTPIYANNDPLRGSKYLLYEGGIRVPMMVSLPGIIPKNVVLDNVVSALDILPTICEVTNTGIPKNVNGIGLMELLKGKQSDIEHDTLFWDMGHEFAVRAGKWKLFISTNNNNAKYEMVDVELGEFLYDLVNDPGETLNVAEQNAVVFEHLKESLMRWRNELR